MSRRLAALALTATLALAGCTPSPDGNAPNSDNPNNCVPVHVATSSEKVNLITKLAGDFAVSDKGKALEESLGKCVVIIPKNVPSGEAKDLLIDGWPTDRTTIPAPVIWSPASSSWVAQLAESKGQEFVPNPVSFAHTPVVMALPEPMAKALGWPNKPIGLRDLHDVCLNPQGWEQFGGSAATWGNFKLAKTNPETSTTGRNILLMQNYAAANKTSGLTEADIIAGNRFTQELESCVIHYGDTTGNVLDRLYQKNSLNYVSAIPLEETSVINYNLGNPTSRVVKEGEQLKKPATRLVAIYPKEGSLESDNPIVALGELATWVTPEQRQVAKAFIEYVQTSAAQSVLGDFGFRPADSSVKPSGLITAENGVDPTKPTVLLEAPSVAVASAATRQWTDVRKPSNIEILLDVSDSMNRSTGDGATRISKAKEGTKEVLRHFRRSDQVGMSTFTMRGDKNVFAQIRPLSPLGGDVESLRGNIDNIATGEGTPLYDAIADAQERVKKNAQPGQINAVLVISDGEDSRSRLSAEDLKRQLRGTSEGNDPAQVRVFVIIYGEDAPTDELRAIAEASGGQVFDAKDPRRFLIALKSAVNNF